jgi:hypothetical protein
MEPVNNSERIGTRNLVKLIHTHLASLTAIHIHSCPKPFLHGSVPHQGHAHTEEIKKQELEPSMYVFPSQRPPGFAYPLHSTE